MRVLLYLIVGIIILSLLRSALARAGMRQFPYTTHALD